MTAPERESIPFHALATKPNDVYGLHGRTPPYFHRNSGGGSGAFERSVSEDHPHAGITRIPPSRVRPLVVRKPSKILLPLLFLTIGEIQDLNYWQVPFCHIYALGRNSLKISSILCGSVTVPLWHQINRAYSTASTYIFFQSCKRVFYVPPRGIHMCNTTPNECKGSSVGRKKKKNNFTQFS